MGDPILAGRDFTSTDMYAATTSVLVSENFCAAILERTSAHSASAFAESPSTPWRQIIGVVGNDRDDGVDQKAPVTVYWPMIIAVLLLQAVRGQLRNTGSKPAERMDRRGP